MTTGVGTPGRPSDLNERIARAGAEMAQALPAKQGSGRREQTIRVAMMLLGHGLNEEQAYPLLCDYNRRCVPPWDTVTDTGALSLGALLRDTITRKGGVGSVSPSVAPAPAAPTVSVERPRTDRMIGARKLAPLSSVEAFQHQLLGAFRVAGLVSGRTPDGSAGCLCPACQDDDAAPLMVTDGAVECSLCQWSAAGESWDIAKAAFEAKAGRSGGGDVGAPGVTAKDASLLARLDARRISLKTPPARPVPVLSIGEQPISTAGNLTVAAAQAKSGKSAAVSAALAAVMVGPQAELALSERADCLGWEATGHQGRAVILFDTEQSPFDAHQLVRRAVDRAGLDALPANVRAFGLVDFNLSDRRSAIAAEMQRASAECNGVCLVMLDGVADFVADVNDPKESNAFVDELMMLAARYSCPFVLVLHENPAVPGQGAGKTRGHLGSQLERKAESCLRLEKDGAGVVTLYGQRLRHGDLPKAKGLCFAWSDQHQRHVSVEAVRTGGSLAGKKPGLPELMVLVPASKPILKGALQELARDAGIAEKRLRNFLEQAIQAGELYEWKVKRAGVPPAVWLARYAQPEEEVPQGGAQV